MLLRVQSFAPSPGTSREVEIGARMKSVVARHTVQAAIHKVGRIDGYNSEGPLYYK